MPGYKPAKSSPWRGAWKIRGTTHQSSMEAWEGIALCVMARGCQGLTDQTRRFVGLLGVF